MSRSSEQLAMPAAAAQRIPADRPLYQRIGDTVRERVANSIYHPGKALPAECELARELQVSQGTLRKAVDALVQENILIRRQGLGTFVAEHTRERMLCLYFNIVRDDGKRDLPESRQISSLRTIATAEERRKLELPARAPVIRVRRMRSIGDNPIIVEHIVLSTALFPGVDAGGTIPEYLYPHFQHAYGVMISRVREELRAIAAPKDAAEILKLPPGAPLLCIDRVALTIARKPVEWRRIFCKTDGYHYACERS